MRGRRSKEAAEGFADFSRQHERRVELAGVGLEFLAEADCANGAIPSVFGNDQDTSFERPGDADREAYARRRRHAALAILSRQVLKRPGLAVERVLLRDGGLPIGMQRQAVTLGF